MVVSRRWKYRALAILGFLLASPFVAHVVLTGEFDTTPTRAGQGEVVIFGLWILSALYLAWSFLVARFEQDTRSL